MAHLSKPYLCWEVMQAECKSACLKQNWSFVSEIGVESWSANGRGAVRRRAESPRALFCQLDPRLAAANQSAAGRLDQSETSSLNLSGASWVGPAWPCCTTTSPQETRGEEDEDGRGGDQHRQHHPAAAWGWDVNSSLSLHLPLLLLHLMDPEIGSCAVHCNRKWSADGQEIPHLKSFIPEYTKKISNCRIWDQFYFSFIGQSIWPSRQQVFNYFEGRQMWIEI